MKNLKIIYYNNDWYCPYCDQLNNTENIINIVQCNWCEGISKVSKTVLAIFLHNKPERRTRKKERPFGQFR